MATNTNCKQFASIQDICLVGLMFSDSLQHNTKVGSSKKAEADQEQVRMPNLPKANSITLNKFNKLNNTAEHQNLLNSCSITGWKQHSMDYLKN